MPVRIWVLYVGVVLEVDEANLLGLCRLLCVGLLVLLGLLDIGMAVFGGSIWGIFGMIHVEL